MTTELKGWYGCALKLIVILIFCSMGVKVTEYDESGKKLLLRNKYWNKWNFVWPIFTFNQFNYPILIFQLTIITLKTHIQKPSKVRTKKGILNSPRLGISTGGRGLLLLGATGWTKLVGTGVTNVSISHGETLSGLIIDAGSSHWTYNRHN